MSRRAYRLGKRQITADLTRTRILDAARALLADTAPLTSFSIEGVAKQAGVARMTVYHQFGNRLGLLEALFDSLAVGGLASSLRVAFEQPEPRDALDAFVQAFCSFWAADRRAIRRLRALGPLDDEVGRGVRVRDERRREAARLLLKRIAIRARRPWSPAWDDAVDVLHTLTSFETFDALAAGDDHDERATSLVTALARSAVASLTDRRD